MKKPEKKGFKPIVNKKALFDYEIIEHIEVGLALSGPEVKSLRLGRASLKESYVKILNGEAYLINFQINPYAFARMEEYESTRTRKLLLHKREVLHLASKTDEKGLALVPVKVYLKRGRFKLEVGLGKGRKEFQKKELLKRRDIERETARDMKSYR